MEPTQEQRADLARRIRAERLERYVTQKAAYIDAGVNSATWAKAEEGDSLAERSLVSIVKLLWPTSGGDWQRLVPPLGSVTLEVQDGELDIEKAVLENPAFTDEQKSHMLRLIREDRERGEQAQTS